LPIAPASGGGTTGEFVQDLRERVLGSPEISAGGFTPYQPAICDASTTARMAINKTFSATHLNVDQELLAYRSDRGRAGGRAWRTCRDQHVVRRAEQSSDPHGNAEVYRLTNGFSKKLDNHSAAVSRYVAHYNLSVPGSRSPFPEHPQSGDTRDGAWPHGSPVVALAS